MKKNNERSMISLTISREMKASMEESAERQDGTNGRDGGVGADRRFNMAAIVGGKNVATQITGAEGGISIIMKAAAKAAGKCGAR